MRNHEWAEEANRAVAVGDDEALEAEALQQLRLPSW